MDDRRIGGGLNPSVRPGDGRSPGAKVVEGGVNFAVHAPYGDSVEVCLFGESEERRLTLPGRQGTVHHGVVTGIGPGQKYGFRVSGRWDPSSGIFSNPAKLLLDPYARSIKGDLVANPALVIHRPRSEERPDERDNSEFVPRSIVTDSRFDWEGDRAPRIPMADTVIYETHVRGLTMLHPSVPSELRGTYSGLVAEPVIEHLRALGVTTIDLLPVHCSVTEPWLQRRGLVNYWGYATAGYFAPNPRYAASDDPTGEFKHMVKVLHREGFEVVLDVVYNHTAEGNHQGATICFRGLDNPGFYKLEDADRRRYVNWTGTGNTVDLTSPWALQLVMDSLRYWVQEMHVDGFRFDLAATLGRAPHRFDPGAPFFLAIQQDPILRDCKLIAEPWDLGPDSYQLGRFPPGWSEWNGRYRDDMRDFWRGVPGLADTIATRLTGSSDIFGSRGPLTSVNLITAHDGFTMADLVSYNQKHNQANGEHNHDGESHNRSWNSGVEGPTDDGAIKSLRRRRADSMLASLLLSQGVPMLLGGDELGRTQGGNNNAYCQDNGVSWYDWERLDWDIVAFVQQVTSLRRRYPQLRRPQFPTGHRRPDGAGDIVWFTAAGEEMTESDWQNGSARSLALLIDDPDSDDPGQSFYLILNAAGEPMTFVLPVGNWEVVVGTGAASQGSNQVEVESFTLTVLQGR
ncbi:MAG TPA: glycogen debranching protein GlgX [Acidimicrobiia bacterium]|nr:glycogen debranching protein GlgX [Acidimicrobiia bacterium]